MLSIVRRKINKNHPTQSLFDGIMNIEELKKEVEKLSEKQQTMIEMSKEISRLAEEENVECLNQMPLLYKLQLKKALGNVGNSGLARQIKREQGFDF